MRSMLTLIWGLALPVLASCAQPPSDHCAGWSQISGSQSAVDWLAAHDPQFLAAVIGHDEFGRSQSCWK